MLDADPANAVFIFAPAGIGYLLGMLTAPWAIARWGARRFGFSYHRARATMPTYREVIDQLWEGASDKGAGEMAEARAPFADGQ